MIVKLNVLLKLEDFCSEIRLEPECIVRIKHHNHCRKEKVKGAQNKRTDE